MAHVEKETSSTLVPPNLFAMGSKHLQSALAARTEIFESLQELSRTWFARMQSEATLASEYYAKLAATRSMSETNVICQEWAGRRAKMAAEDAKLLLSDGQKFMQTGASLLTKASPMNGDRSTT